MGEVNTTKLDYVTRNGGPWFISEFYGTPDEEKYKDYLGELPRFDAAGNPKAVIAYVGGENNTINDREVFQIVVYVWCPELKKGDFWKCEWSDSYAPNSQDTWKQKSIAQLNKIGWNGSEDIAEFARQYIGKEITIWVKEAESKKTGNKYYLVGGLGESRFKQPKSVSFDMFRTGAKAASPAASPTSGAGGNVFADSPF